MQAPATESPAPSRPGSRWLGSPAPKSGPSRCRCGRRSPGPRPGPTQGSSESRTPPGSVINPPPRLRAEHGAGVRAAPCLLPYDAVRSHPHHQDVAGLVRLGLLDDQIGLQHDPHGPVAVLPGVDSTLAQGNRPLPLPWSGRRAKPAAATCPATWGAEGVPSS